MAVHPIYPIPRLLSDNPEPAAPHSAAPHSADAILARIRAKKAQNAIQAGVPTHILADLHDEIAAAYARAAERLRASTP